MQVNIVEIDKIAKNLFSELQKIRRHLHKNPELGRQEFHTSRYLKNKLLGFGNFTISMVGKTGFTADLVQSKSAPWLALRADMDALPIPDEKSVSYKSEKPNLCHACGHDFHSTVVLGVAKILTELKEKYKGNIRFIFQHAEEPIPGGALDFVRADKLHKIDLILGIHADPKLPVNTISILPGLNTAQSIHFKIKIKGKGGHSSRPNDTIDPIFIGISTLNALYGALYRQFDDKYPFVFTVGKIETGGSYNIIPDFFSAEGTLRVTNEKLGDKLLSFMENSIKSEAKKWSTTADFEFIKGAPAVNNDPEMTNLMQNYALEIIDVDHLVSVERSWGAEDFAHYQTKLPGVFIRVGVANKQINQPLHSSRFDIDEKAITFTVKTLSYLILRYFTDKNNN